MFKNLKKDKEKLCADIDKLIYILEKSNIFYLAEIIGNKKEIIKRNIIAGIARGIGIGIGVTIITAMLILFLRHLVTLNIPIIGKYISDIVEIVEKNK